MSERQALRVTIEGSAREITPESADARGLTLDGAILRSATGSRRFFWAVRPQAGHADVRGTLKVELVLDGWRFGATVEAAAHARLREKARRGAAALRGHHRLVLRAPIPGRVGSVRVSEGAAVAEGETLLTLEAMKMENLVRAPRAGTIDRVAVSAGQTVELGDALVELE